MNEKNTKTKKFKYWNIEIDGPDRVGKTTLAKYITQLSNYRFATHDRGYMTQVVYSKKFNRGYNYTMPSKNTIYILLSCDPDDHDIRCKITNEPHIDFKNDMKLFEEVYNHLIANEYKCLHFDTSTTSTIDIAKAIIDCINIWEGNR